MDVAQWIQLAANLGGFGVMAFALLKMLERYMEADRLGQTEQADANRKLQVETFGQMLTLATRSAEAMAASTAAIEQLKQAIHTMDNTMGVLSRIVSRICDSLGLEIREE